MYETVLYYPLEMVRAVATVRGAGDIVLVAAVLLILWHVAVVARSKLSLQGKLVGVIGDWVLLVALYIITTALNIAGVYLSPEHVAFLKSTVLAGVPWVILAGKLADWLEEAEDIIVQPRSPEDCENVNAAIASLGVFVVLLAAATANRVGLLTALLLLAVSMLYVVAGYIAWRKNVLYGEE